MPVNCVAILDYHSALLFFNVLFQATGLFCAGVEQFTNIEDHPFFITWT